MRKEFSQWLDELERQVRGHGLNGWLWVTRFGCEGILPDDENAVCELCHDRLFGFCSRTDRTPLDCMRSLEGNI